MRDRVVARHGAGGVRPRQRPRERGRRRGDRLEAEIGEKLRRARIPRIRHDEEAGRAGAARGNGLPRQTLSYSACSAICALSMIVARDNRDARRRGISPPASAPCPCRTGRRSCAGSPATASGCAARSRARHCRASPSPRRGASRAPRRRSRMFACALLRGRCGCGRRSCTSASPPPTAASGEALRIEGEPDVPDCRPSPMQGSSLMPRFRSASGGCMFTTSAPPG